MPRGTPGNGNPHDPANPSANQYRCGFRGLVSTLEDFAAGQGIARPTDYEVYDEPDGAQVSDSCDPTPDGDLPCATPTSVPPGTTRPTPPTASFANRLTLVAPSADGDSANDPNLVAVKAYASYLNQTIGLHPTVWSFHPYEDLSATADMDDGRSRTPTRRSSARTSPRCIRPGAGNPPSGSPRRWRSSPTRVCRNPC